MNHPQPLNRDIVLAQFSRNLPRHIIGVSQALNERLMSQCVNAGHAGLRASFNQVLSRLNATGTRVVDVANACGITQQAAGQIVGELEKLGYIKRKPDTHDKRAKHLVFTAKGTHLMADCARLAEEINAELADTIGAAAFAEFQNNCAQLYESLVLGEHNHAGINREAPYYLALCLSGIATYCEQELMELDKQKGHSRLKMSFSQVISYISPHGSLINELAKINGVSKQAISQVVKEVEDLGYIERKHNPHDARSTKLYLSDFGMKLIEDSVENISVIRAQFVRILRERKVKQFAQCIETLYDYLCLSSAHLLDESLRLRVENHLQRLAEKFYRDEIGEVERKTLFTRAGNKMRLSNAALEIFAKLEIKTGGFK